MMYNILDFGAVADGVTMNTKAINAAVEKCAEAGGGRVVIPAGGVFMSGTIWLKSHVELHLEHGAVLKASGSFDDYCSDDDYEQNWHSDAEEWTGGHLIAAVEQEDVAVTGSGTIDGNVWAFLSENDTLHDKWVNENHLYCWFRGFLRAKRPGQTIALVECKNVCVTDITMRELPSWGLFVYGCDRVQICGVKVYNRPDIANTDGLDIDSCRYVTVSDCIIDTGDDAIAIRNGLRRLKDKNRLCEYVTITNCVLASCSSVFRIGVGIGELRHMRISNLTVNRGSTLINFNTEYGTTNHTPISDVNFSNISATDIAHPFQFNTYSGIHVDRVTLENIRTEARACSNIVNQTADTGVFSDITLRNFDIFLVDDQPVIDDNIRRQRGDYVINCQNASGLRFENVRIFGTDEVKAKWSGMFRMENCPKTEISGCNF